MNTTPSGLQYKDTVIGDGAEAAKGNLVAVHYTGWLYNNGVAGANQQNRAFLSQASLPIIGSYLIPITTSCASLNCKWRWRRKDNLRWRNAA